MQSLCLILERWKALFYSLMQNHDFSLIQNCHFSLMHVTDWIPTLVSAGGNRFRGNVDGFDVWASLSNLQTSPRKEMLYNIDPYNGDTKLGNTKKRNKNAAIRVGNMKLIVGGISLTISSMLCFYQTSKNIPSYTKIFGKL
jgi:arylsulfatase A-like enzyme